MKSMTVEDTNAKYHAKVFNKDCWRVFADHMSANKENELLIPAENKAIALERRYRETVSWLRGEIPEVDATYLWLPSQGYMHK